MKKAFACNKAEHAAETMIELGANEEIQAYMAQRTQNASSRIRCADGKVLEFAPGSGQFMGEKTAPKQSASNFRASVERWSMDMQ